MATTAIATATYPRTWTEFFVRNRKNGDTIEELFAANMAGMTLLTAEHLANTGKLTDTIIGSSHANMIMVPGRPGQMHLLHHGFGASSSEGFNLIFIQGNLSDSAIFKMLPRESAVAQIRGEEAEGPRLKNDAVFLEVNTRSSTWRQIQQTKKTDERNGWLTVGADKSKPTNTQRKQVSYADNPSAQTDGQTRINPQPSQMTTLR